MRRMNVLIGGSTPWTDRRRIRNALIAFCIPIVGGLLLFGYSVLKYVLAS